MIVECGLTAIDEERIREEKSVVNLVNGVRYSCSDFILFYFILFYFIFCILIVICVFNL